MSLHQRKMAKDAANEAAKAASAERATEARKMKALQEKRHALVSQERWGLAAGLRKSLALRMLQLKIEMQENALDAAIAKKADKEGLARAASQAFDAAMASKSSNPPGQMLERPTKRLRTSSIPLPSWTTGMIFSGSARYWRPETHGWVQGYPHVSDRSHTQRFILHLDTGNTAQTCISQQAFDFLGLNSCSNRLRQTQMHGVNGQVSMCSVYEIQFSVDLVNRAHQISNHIKKRTVEAAVINVPGQPGEVGYFDLLLSATDVRKFLNMELPGGAKLVFDVLDAPPTTLYDGCWVLFESSRDVRFKMLSAILDPCSVFRCHVTFDVGRELLLRERFSEQPARPARRPRPTSLPFPSFDRDFPPLPDWPSSFPDFFGPGRTQHASTACVLAVG